MAEAASKALTTTQFNWVTATIATAVLMHAVWMPTWLVALLATLIAAGAFLKRQRSRPMARWPRVLLTLGLLATIILAFGNVFGRQPGAALLCAMLALKLYECDRLRDGRAAVTYACFVLMAALLFVQSLWLTLLLALALLVAVASMIALQPNTSGPIQRRPGETLGTLRTAALMLAHGVPFAAAAFLFFPRLASPLWGAPGDASEARTGISDTMSPGSIRELFSDDRPAFRVVFDGPVPAAAEMYWRGPVLWAFDGETWSRPRWRRGLPQTAVLTSAKRRIAYEVTMEPTEQVWLPALDVPIDSTEAYAGGNDHVLAAPQAVIALRRYRVESALDYSMETVLGPGSRLGGLQLPDGYNPRAVELARSWRNQLGNDAAIIRAALDLFHGSFVYSLNPPPLLGRDKVDDFLFGTRTGYCEHFSSAFTFLMRAAGIPTRVATGYQGGYFNPLGGYFLVRNSDAHAWSEVWLVGRGWVRVDPTAAIHPARIERGAQQAFGADESWWGAGWLGDMRNRFDLVNQIWNQAIVQFSALRQGSLLHSFGVERGSIQGLAWALLIATALALALVAVVVLRQTRQTRDPLVVAYRRFCQTLGRAGVKRQSAEGPRAYADRAATAFPSRAAAIRAVSEHFISLRYANFAYDAAGLREFRHAVRRFRLKVR